MKNKKILIIIIIILGITTISMGSYIIYNEINNKNNNIIQNENDDNTSINNNNNEVKDNENNINTENNNNDENNDNNKLINYTYDGIKGLYKYVSETIKDELGNEYRKSYYLYLYENGTFNYRMGTYAPFGYMGNYIIKDNTIILNYLFETNSGAGIDVTDGSETIRINDKNTLIDMDNVKLKKATVKEENEFLNGSDFSDMLNNYIITNNVNNG